MRVKKLELLRYGHLEGTELNFPLEDQAPDFHLVFGPNEAGKSTARLALEDFLFGVPRQSSLGFKHGNANLQIGAQLETEHGSFEAIRRKGDTNTLRHRDTNEALEQGESTLRRALNNNSLEFFKAMFSLDHERLRRGAQTILDANDDVGRALFSATAGLIGLQDRLDAWRGEADQLWAPRKSVRRKYYVARDQFDEARKRVVEFSIKASDWESKREAVEQLESALKNVEDQIHQLEPRRRKLARIRRVKAKVSRYFEIADQLEGLKDCPQLPENAADRLSDLVANQQSASQRTKLYADEAKQLDVEAKETTFDEGVLEKAEEIEELNDLRAKVERSERELARRQQELQELRQRQSSLAGILGWESADVISQRVPSRQRNRTLRDLVEKHRILGNELESARDEQRSAEERKRELLRDADSAGPVVELATLQAAIEYAQKESDEVAHLPRLHRQLESQIEKVNQINRSLFPAVAEEAVDLVKTPSRKTIQSAQDELRGLDEEFRSRRNGVRELDSRIALSLGELESFERSKEFVTAEDLADLRSERDQQWTSLKEQYFEWQSSGTKPTENERQDIGSHIADYEQKVKAADDKSDKRFETAESLARYNEMRLNCEKLRRQRDLQENLMHEAENQVKEFNQRWREQWSDAPFDVADPETMLTWYENFQSLRTATDQKNDMQREVEQLSQRGRDAQSRLQLVLSGLLESERPLTFSSLPEAIAYARSTDAKTSEINVQRKGLEERLKEATIEVDRQSGKLNELELQKAEWETQWRAALDGTVLSQEHTPERVSEMLDTFDDLREAVSSIDTLVRNEIQPIERDIAEFNDRVESQIAGSNGMEGEEPTIKKVQRLVERLRYSQVQRARRDNLNKRAEELKEKQEEATVSLNEITSRIDEMRSVAGADDINQLRVSIRKSDDQRELLRERVRLREELEQDGDGQSVQELLDECDTVHDLDAARSEETELESKLADLREEQQTVLKDCVAAKQRLDETIGSDSAAQAETDRQCALTDMRNAIEDYIPIRAAAVALDWAIDRFRKERQGPLVKRAAEIFETLTLGSFVQLETQMGNKGPTLIAYRGSGDAVSLGGLSEGTVDQLYLALRIAAIEKHIDDTSSSLPLVVDDLFTNFDDERATAGLRVLNELSLKCQVLFFTHHRHLVDIARDVGGTAVSIRELPAYTSA